MSNTTSQSKTSSKWVFFIPIIIAIAIFAVMKKNQTVPQRSQPQERITTVRTIPVPALDIVPLASGHGSVQPAKTWSAISEVKGKIIYKHPKLEKGAILPAGTLLLEVDPTNYQLNLAQTQADIAATQAQIQELDTKQKNTRASLKIEQNSLKLTEKELQRQKKLVKQGSVSFSDVEKQERTRLSQQQSVQNQRNTLNLIPSQKALLEAQLLRQQAVLKSLQRDLENTQIKLPFNGRIAQVNVEQAQYVREGENLMDADGLSRAEIEVQLPINRLRAIIQSDHVVNAENASPDQLRQQLGFKATVFLNEGNQRVSWPAQFARLSDTLDPKTRTVGVIVSVDNPYANVQPGIKPPLVKGLFVEVKISGIAHKNAIIVPTQAVHHNSDTNQYQVYVVNAEGRLAIRPVKIKLTQEQYTVIASGINAGEQLVISELLPAIANMRLKPHNDESSLMRLKQAASAADMMPSSTTSSPVTH